MKIIDQQNVIEEQKNQGNIIYQGIEQIENQKQVQKFRVQEIKKENLEESIEKTFNAANQTIAEN